MITLFHHPVFFPSIHCKNRTPFIDEVYQCMQDFCEEMNNDTKALYCDFDEVIWLLKNKIRKIEEKYPEEEPCTISGPVYGSSNRDLAVEVFLGSSSWACISAIERLDYETQKVDPFNFKRIIYEEIELSQMRVIYRKHRTDEDPMVLHKKIRDYRCEDIRKVKTKYTRGKEILLEYYQNVGTGKYPEEFEDYVWTIIGAVGPNHHDIPIPAKRMCQALEVAERRNKRVLVKLAPEYLSGKDAEEFRRKHPKYPPELIGYRSEQFGNRSFRIEYV